MKILKYAGRTISLLLFFIHFSCVNEPLEGDFPQDDGVLNIEEGEFRANVGIGDFSTGLALGILSNTDLLTITGTIPDTGESIVLTIENPGVGTFNITAGLGTQNSGVYIESNPENPFVSDGTFGVFGQLNITEFDTQNATVSGTFSFTGVRVVLDVDGNPVLDSNGQPTLETEEITNGVFNKIPYTTEDQGGGGTPITDEFFAKVDGVNFDTESVTTSLNTVAGVSVVKIVAVNELGEIIRIDIPEDLGIGTFAMEPLSDGTKLIGLFNPATVGENLTSNPGTINITRFNVFTGIIEADIEIGTYEMTTNLIDGSEKFCQYTPEIGETITYISNPGTLTISDYDQDAGFVEGTFTFTALDLTAQDPEVYQITEGEFTIEF